MVLSRSISIPARIFNDTNVMNRMSQYLGHNEKIDGPAITGRLMRGRHYAVHQLQEASVGKCRGCILPVAAEDPWLIQGVDVTGDTVEQIQIGPVGNPTEWWR